MESQERNKHFKDALSEMRKRIPGEEVGRTIQQVRVRWLQRQSEGSSPKQLDQEVSILDAMAPLLTLMTSTIFQDSNLMDRLSDRKDPRSFNERIYETATRCLLELEKGVVLEEEQIRGIAEQVIAQEPLPIDTPKEVIAFLERLKERGRE